MAVAVTIGYQTVLAILYGGYPFYRMYPDEFWIISNAVFLTKSMPLSAFPFYPKNIAADKVIALPLFEATLHEMLGFPLFLYFLCIWNIAIMTILICCAYIIGKQFFGQKVGYLAALLIGWNWHIGWYGQRLLLDAGMMAFEFLTIVLYLRYIRNGDLKYLFASGLAAALTIWTKETALFLLPPIIVLLMLKNRQKISYTPIFLVAVIIGISPFMYICNMRYGNPLFPFVSRWTQFQAASPGLVLNTYYVMQIPFSISLIVSLFLILGIILLIKKRNYLFLVWGAFPIAFYMFIVPFGGWDYYLINYTPILLTIAAVGLENVTDIFIKKWGKIGIVPIPLSLVFTNLYGSPMLYSLSRGKISTLTFLHQRVQWNKYDAISQLIQQVESKQSDWWFAQLFYDSPGPDFTLIALTAIVFTFFVFTYGYLRGRRLNLDRIILNLKQRLLRVGDIL